MPNSSASAKPRRFGRLARAAGSRLIPVVLTMLTGACGGAPAPAAPIGASESRPAEPGGIWPRRESDLERGREALRAGRAREAAARFDRAIERGEDRAAALHDRAVANLAMARHSSALADADAAVQAGGGQRSLLLRSAIQVRLGMHGLAEPTLRQLADDGSDDAARLLIVVCAETGRPDESATIARRVVAAGADDCATLNDAAVALDIAGQDAQARDLYDRAIGADAECIEAWRNLAMLELRLQRHDAAERSLETYLRLAPLDTIDRAVMQGRLDTLRAR